MSSSEHVSPRLAVSVIMLRHGGHALETFIQNRVSTMDFAAGVVVFPGGRVDDVDNRAAVNLEADEALLNRHAHSWRNTSVGSDHARSPADASAVLLAAACREVREETGARVDAGRLVPWANWVTPPGHSKRFDTYFYVTRADRGSQPQHQTTEADSSHWAPLRQILQDEADGRLKLMRPTKWLLTDLAGFDDIDSILGLSREIHPVTSDRPE
ncbi:NUDIX hydrolase [Saxibacter everestensis]|uniref:NUDIX hydrolase n=1 Tax=Saxibacter everestensis TaxID=2909229 RepID=A0ABY8R001_9MICO|nr:NUDIX hydrolase [Brevibacteriaceae bacterium ZFBP1038]